MRQELGRQGLGLAELFVRDQPLGPGGGLAQGLGIGRRPGAAVGHMLVAVQRRAVEASVPAHALAHRVL